jgi:hypothetical protein
VRVFDPEPGLHLSVELGDAFAGEDLGTVDRELAAVLVEDPLPSEVAGMPEQGVHVEVGPTDAGSGTVPKCVELLRRLAVAQALINDQLSDLVDRRSLRLLDPASLESLRRFERWTRVAEAVHVVGFVGFAALAGWRFIDGSLSATGLGVALLLDLTFGLWPAVLQRYNRLRLCRARRALERD